MIFLTYDRPPRNISFVILWYLKKCFWVRKFKCLVFTYSSQHFSNVSEWKLMTNFSGQIMCNCNENLSQLETHHDWLLNVAGQPIRGTISNSPMFPKLLHMIQPLLHVNYVLLIIYFIDGRSLIRITYQTISELTFWWKFFIFQFWITFCNMK